MTRIPSKFLVLGSTTAGIGVLTLVNNIVSERHSMLPRPVEWVVLVLAAVLLLVSAGELRRRGARRGPGRQER